MTLLEARFCLGKKVLWRKGNLATGFTEVLTGTLIDCGVGPHIGNVEYAVVLDHAGREWITLVACIQGLWKGEEANT